MRAVVQRVARARVTPGGEIGRGLCVLLGVAGGDGEEQAARLAGKVARLRIFPDDDGRFDRSVEDVAGSVLVVSQFTLAGDCRKGRRPSFDAAAAPEVARPLYEEVVRGLEAGGIRVATGQFQAMMQVSLVNDGPITLLLDSRKTF